MPLYEYVCPQCNRAMSVRYSFVEYANAPVHECACGAVMARRVGRFAFHRGMEGHFNSSTGTYVPNARAFRDELKRKSEEATIRTGIPHNYTPVDYRDKSALGVTNEGLDATAERAREQVS